jgi:hypothetical protein
MNLLFQKLASSELGTTQQFNILDAAKKYCNWTGDLKFVQFKKKCTYHSVSTQSLLKKCRDRSKVGILTTFLDVVTTDEESSLEMMEHT